MVSVVSEELDGRGAAALLSPEQVARAVEQEFEELDFICARRIREISGADDLARLSQLELCIDTGAHTLSPLGHLCPALAQLKLRAPSKLRSFRDLGTSLRRLRVLWAPRCGVTDLDGISVLPGLEELYVSFNRIADVTPLAMHERLQVLDLEGNDVAAAQQVDQLATCDALSSLTLAGNPVTELVAYRRAVVHLVPHLAVLDEEPVSDADRVPCVSEHILSLVYQNVRDKDYQKQIAKAAERGGGGGGDGGDDAQGKGTTRRSSRPHRATAAAAANRVPSPHDDAADVTLSLQGGLDVNERMYDGDDHHHEDGGASKTTDNNSSKSARPGGGRGGRPMAGGHRFVSKSSGISLMASRPGRGVAGSSSSPRSSSSSGQAAARAQADAHAKKGKTASSSSELTHGADVVFAGSAVGALRRRRRAVKEGSQVGGRGGGGRPNTAPNQRSGNGMAGGYGTRLGGRGRSGSRVGGGSAGEGKQSGAGGSMDDSNVSITATLDRAQELETEMKNKATSDSRRADILFELRSWRPDEDSRGGADADGSYSSFNHVVRTSALNSPRRASGGVHAGSSRPGGSPRQEGWTRNRPTSSSSAPSTPPSTLAAGGRRGGAGGMTSAERRRATRQPGDASGVLVEWPNKHRRKKKKKSKSSKAGDGAEGEEEGDETSYGALKSFLAQGGKGKSGAAGEGGEEGGDDNDGDSSSSEGSPGGNSSWARRRSRRKRSGSGPATSPSSSTTSDKTSTSEGQAGALRLSLGKLTEVDHVGAKMRDDGDGDGNGDDRGGESSDDEMNLRIANLEAMMEGEAGMRHLDSPPPTPRPDITEILGRTKTPPGLEDDAMWRRDGGSRGSGRRKDSRGSRRGSPRGGNSSHSRSSSSSCSHNNNSREEEAGGDNSHVGRADRELITMLKIKPKRVPQLRTEEGFQMYFEGISEARMRSLLEQAYEHLKPKERAKKVRRRMALLAGHFS